MGDGHQRAAECLPLSLQCGHRTALAATAAACVGRGVVMGFGHEGSIPAACKAVVGGCVRGFVMGPRVSGSALGEVAANRHNLPDFPSVQCVGGVGVV